MTVAPPIAATTFRTLVLAVIAASFCACGTPGPSQPPFVTLDWAGTYTNDPATLQPAPRAAAGMIGYTENPHRLLTRTTAIEAVGGTRFGIQFRFSGLPAGSKVAYTVIARFPSGGLTNPDTGRTTLFDSHRGSCSVGQPCQTGRQLSAAWTLIPGTWTFEIWVDGRLTLSQDFRVSRK